VLESHISILHLLHLAIYKIPPDQFAKELPIRSTGLTGSQNQRLINYPMFDQTEGATVPTIFVCESSAPAWHIPFITFHFC